MKYIATPLLLALTALSALSAWSLVVAWHPQPDTLSPRTAQANPTQPASPAVPLAPPPPFTPPARHLAHNVALAAAHARHVPVASVRALVARLRHRDVRWTTIRAALAYVHRYWAHAGRLPHHARVDIRFGKAPTDDHSAYLALAMRHGDRSQCVFLVRESHHGLLLADGHGRMLQAIDLRNPVVHTRISSGWGWRTQPVLGWHEFHKGIDYAAPIGTPVRAAMSGVVDLARWHGNYGRLVEVRHPDHLATRYGHLSRFAKGVTRGTHVRRGQVIGYVGTTGLSTGPHLYFELWRHGRRIDPLRAALVRIHPRTASHRELLAWVRHQKHRSPASELAAP